MRWSVFVSPVSGPSLVVSLMVLQCLRPGAVGDFFGMNCVIHRAVNNQDKGAGLGRSLELQCAVLGDAEAGRVGSKPVVPQNTGPILTTLIRTSVGLPLSGSNT